MLRAVFFGRGGSVKQMIYIWLFFSKVNRFTIKIISYLKHFVNQNNILFHFIKQLEWRYILKLFKKNYIIKNYLRYKKLHLKYIEICSIRDTVMKFEIALRNIGKLPDYFLFAAKSLNKKIKLQ